MQLERVSFIIIIILKKAIVVMVRLVKQHGSLHLSVRKLPLVPRRKRRKRKRKIKSRCLMNSKKRQRSLNSAPLPSKK